MLTQLNGGQRVLELQDCCLKSVLPTIDLMKKLMSDAMHCSLQVFTANVHRLKDHLTYEMPADLPAVINVVQSIPDKKCMATQLLVVDMWGKAQQVV